MLPAEDFEEFDILPHLLEAIAFVSRAETSGGCAFVHCNYGVNRSGVVAAAYLMVAERKPLLQVSPYSDPSTARAHDFGSLQGAGGAGFPFIDHAYTRM